MFRSVVVAMTLIASSAAFAASQSAVAVKSISFKVDDIDTSDFTSPKYRALGSWTIYETSFDNFSAAEVFSRGRLFDMPTSIDRAFGGASVTARASAQQVDYRPSDVTYSSDVLVAGSISHAQTAGISNFYSSSFYVRGPWEGSSGFFDVGPKTRLTISAHVELSAETTVGSVVSGQIMDWSEHAGAMLSWGIYGVRSDQTQGMLASGKELIYASSTATDWDPVLQRYMRHAPQSKYLSFDVVAIFENDSASWQGGSIAFNGTAWGGSDIPYISPVPEPGALATWSVGVVFLLGIITRRRTDLFQPRASYSPFV